MAEEPLHKFDDIEPLPLVPEGSTVATILYTDDYKYALGLLKALQARKEYSDRALWLTQEVIKLNASHYTVWQYRYRNIISLKKDINEELDWVEEIALDNLKNYQIWHYRQLLLTHENIRDIKRELPLIETILDDDSKNYHVWSYRKWLVQFTDVWDYELEASERFIHKDIYNNSAWTHRYFALCHQDFSLDDEIRYVVDKIQLAPQNISPWNYLKGILELKETDLTRIKELAQQYADLQGVESIKSIPALEILVKINEKDNKDLSLKGLDLLAKKYDTMRSNYWRYRKSLIK